MKELKYFQKTKREAEKEVFILYRLIKKEKPDFTEEQVYKEIRKHLDAKGKRESYAGARFLPFSLVIGVLVSTFTVFFVEAQNDLIIERVVQSIIIFVVFMVGISPIVTYDTIARKEIYKISIMTEIINEKLR